MALDDGDVPAKAQTSLSDAQLALNYFLSCQCVPQVNISVRRIETSALRQNAEVVEKFKLSDQVLCLRLKADMAYLSGQYVTIWKDDSVGRSYSLASLPDQDESLEFHIKLIEGGAVSGWLNNHIQTGDHLEIQGPMGQCIYTAKPDQPLLLSAIGTGLAPIVGLLRHALSTNHAEPIHLVIGAKQAADFYLLDRLEAICQAHSNVHLHLVTLEEASGEVRQADIYAYCKQQFPSLINWRVFLCGADSFVLKMRKQCFLSGAAMKDISADPFLAFSGN